MSVVNWYNIMIWIDFSKKSLLHKTLMPFSVLLLKIWFEATNTQFYEKEWYFLYWWKCGIEASNHICRSNTENAIIVLSNSLFSENGRGIIMIIWLSCFPSLTFATQFSSGRSSSSLLLSKEKDLMDHVPDSYWILSQLQTNLFWQMRKRWTAIKNQDIPKRPRTNLSFSKDYILFFFLNMNFLVFLEWRTVNYHQTAISVKLY